MADDLEPGAWVTPTVRLLRPLAQGGMGKVWVAEHRVLDTEVVVKLMTKEAGSCVEGAARFSREAAIAAAVKSPHVVQVFDSGVNDAGIPYIVMELLEGHDLGAHLAARGRMTPGEVVVIIAQLAKALARAHRSGIVHRDIKPENVFLCEVEGAEIFVKLLDFGTAKDEQRAPYKTSTGQLVGTPYYMSPEQILGGEVDARSDIWSLGVLAFEALTGVRPFEGATVGAITLAIHTAQPRMTDVAPELPPLLDDWFAHACAFAPEERFQSATAAAVALEHAIWGDVAVDVLADTAQAPIAPIAIRSPSDRVPISLSSTLHAPRRSHRTMTWIATAVALAAGGAMAAVVATERAPVDTPAPVSRPAKTPATSAPSPPAMAAPMPGPSSAATAAPSATSTPTAPATVAAIPAAPVKPTPSAASKKNRATTAATALRAAADAGAPTEPDAGGAAAAGSSAGADAAAEPAAPTDVPLDAGTPPDDDAFSEPLLLPIPPPVDLFPTPSGDP